MLDSINKGVKAAGLDKKLYKILNRYLEERYLSDLALSQSMSPPSPNSPTFPHRTTPATINGIPSISSRRRRRSSLSPIERRPELLPAGGQSLPTKITYGPFGSMDTVSSRKTLVYLIATLNATHPNHDFKTISPESFRRERNVRHTLAHILPPSNPAVQTDLLALLEKEMEWRITGANPDCLVYSVDEATIMDALPGGTVWCTTLFWVNKKLKRVLFLEVQGRSIMSPTLEATDDMSDWEEEEGVLGELEMDL